MPLSLPLLLLSYAYSEYLLTEYQVQAAVDASSPTERSKIQLLTSAEEIKKGLRKLPGISV